ncbi:MAG: hypothetical protein AAGH64_08535 [Planctomycetota bacterium]
MRRASAPNRAAWEALMREFVSEDDLRGIVDALKLEAKDGDTTAASIILSYRFGRPRLTPLVIPEDAVELGPMSNAQECATAIVRIAEAQVAGRLNDEQAESLRKTLDRAMRIHLAGAEQEQDNSRPIEVVVQSYAGGRATEN